MAEENKNTKKEKVTTRGRKKSVGADNSSEKVTVEGKKTTRGGKAASGTAETKAKATTKAVRKPTQKEQEDTWSLLTDFDIHLFREGRHFSLYKKLGAHLTDWQGQKGVVFAVWAPNAQNVSVVGNFNNWNRNSHPMYARHDSSGIWEVFIPELGHGEVYKYFIRSNNGYEVEKADPFAFRTEVPPQTASVVTDLEYNWKDGRYMNSRKKKAEKAVPMSVYEMHLASWMRVPEEDNRSLTYREMADKLVDYVKDMDLPM